MKESFIQTAIEQMLKYYENLGLIFYQKNNSGAYKTAKGGFVRFGKAGSPDFYVFCKNGKTLHLEIKNEKGKLNENQKVFQEKITKLGFNYHIVRSVDEVKKLL